MKRSFTIFFLMLTTGFFISCTYDKKEIIDPVDYAAYMDDTRDSLHKYAFIESDLAFWNNRFQKNKSDLVAQTKIASLHTMRYKITGDVNDIIFADSLYRSVNRIQKQFGSATFRSLAANCVTQHEFKQAQAYLDSALQSGDDKDLTKIQQIDVAIELGHLNLAKRILTGFADKKSVPYLIRSAKIKDHEGDLDGAIICMEKAYLSLQAEKREALYSWALSSLGDMYSHANRFSEAYESYLQALAIEKSEFHALKGIAWIAFSHDRNPVEAKRILLHLKDIHPVPDYDLILAEVSAYENDNDSKQKYQHSFVAEVSKPSYKGMYNKYLFYLYADDLQNFEEAYKIAIKETENRPTGESYNFLSWALFKKGEYEQARKIASRNVENVCYEPDALFNMAVIYGTGEDKQKARKYLREAHLSLFELGPGYEEKIKYWKNKL
jgi:tetratricopeptide (TPR) repeat protein